MAFSGSQQTRFSHSALYTRPVGSFASKESETPATGPPSGSLMLMGVGISYFGITVILKLLMELGYGR